MIRIRSYQQTRMTSRLKAREKYKRAQYRLADERYEELGLGRICVLCRISVPGGSHRASAHHEILSKAELPGRKNWEILFSPANVAPACGMHHDKLGHLRLVWLKSMVVVGLARAEQYRLKLFSAFWQDELYPPCGECVGHLGYGTEYFQSGDRLPDSLARLYKLANREFDVSDFCKTCSQAVRCRLLTAGGMKKRLGEGMQRPGDQ
jgi:hypothetical protein